jgi:hypothetical protein
VYVSLNDFFKEKMHYSRIIVVDRLGLNLGGANKKGYFFSSELGCVKN